MGTPAESIEPASAPAVARKYRKVGLIEAVQFNKLGDHPAVVATSESPTGFGIATLENTKLKFEVTPGDWIASGQNGEHWPIKPDVFATTYEPAE